MNKPEFLVARAWCFQAAGGGPARIPHVRLFPGGAIAGETDPNARRWELRDGRLAFLDGLGRVATTFYSAEFDADGRAILTGRYRDGSAHLLREVALVKGLAAPSPLEMLGPGRTAERANLVIVRANEQSIHPGWTDDLPDPERSWDLCVSWYGKTETFAATERTELVVLQNVDGKLQALYKLLHEDSLLWEYEYIAIVDDDMDMTRSAINVMFEVCREYRLELAQPSLHPSSVITQHETCQQPAFILRYVNYVEPMMTIFSRKTLRACIGTFALDEPAAMGYGIDYIWPRLVDGPPTAVAVIDKVAVVHTRAHGANYDVDLARAEGAAAAARFGNRDYLSQQELGGIYAWPTRRDAKFNVIPNWGVR